MALETLEVVAAVRLSAASKRSDTARPPASSEAEAIFEPLDSRWRLFCKSELLLLKFCEASVAEVFVLIETGITSFLF
jgi:hypothetical protein